MTKADKRAALFIAAAVLAVLAVFAFKLVVDRAPKPNQENCVGISLRNTVILLDYTEVLATQTKDEIVARTMRHIYDKVLPNERVSIFTISDLSQKSLKPVKSLCRPPDDGNRLVENVRKIKQDFQKKFEQPIRAALELPITGAKNSPIAQAVTDLSLSQYMRGEANTLLIFSDMLENTSKFTLYGCKKADTVIPRYIDAVRGSKVRPTFKNTTVVLNYVPRSIFTQDMVKCRDTFWPWFFGDNEGAQAGVSPDYLPGL